jgi:hypothetical protein
VVTIGQVYIVFLQGAWSLIYACSGADLLLAFEFGVYEGHEDGFEGKCPCLAPACEIAKVATEAFDGLVTL